MDKEKSLEIKLGAYIETIRDDVNTLKSENRIPGIETYKLCIDGQIDYRGLSVRPQPQIQLTNNNPDISSLVKQVKKKRTYIDLENYINVNFEDTTRLKNIISSLTTKTITDVIEGKEIDKNRILAIAMSDTRKTTKPNYVVVSKCTGIHICPDESFSINWNQGELLFRAVEKKDIEREWIFFLEPFTIHDNKMPTCIIEFTTSSLDVNQINEAFRSLEGVLQLYKCGSVQIYERVFHCDSFDMNNCDGGRFCNHRFTSSPYTYQIKRSEAKTIETFLALFSERMNKKKKQNESITTDISKELYHNALFKSSSRERLMYSTMGLESLFVSDQGSEISYRLRMRLTKLMTLLGDDKEITENNIKKAYDYRSKIVHGTKIKSEWDKEIMVLLDPVINYLRISLLVSMCLPDSKKDFVGKIEDSFFSTNPNEDLVNALEQVRPYCFFDHNHR